MFKVEDTLTHIIYKCYGWITGGDGYTYGICSENNSPFILIEYNKLKPVGDKKLNG